MSDHPTDVIIPFVLDQSGSMQSCVTETVEGFNTFLGEQRKQDGNAWLSLTLFDTSFDVRYVAWGLKDVPDMTADGPNTFRPNGMTALYDAVGVTIQGTEAWLKNNPWFTGKVLFVILTDGGENSSSKWHITRLNDKIAEKRAEGWEFIFLGAGGAAWTEGNKFTSIPTSSRIYTDGSKAAHRQTYAGVSASTTSLRSSGVTDNSILTGLSIGNVEEAPSGLDADEAVANLSRSSQQQ